LKALKIIMKIIAAIIIFFMVTFTVYFLNLDMKLLSRVEPFLLKHYDNMPRKTYL